MAGVLERVRVDRANGELWKARRRLEGYVGSVGYQRDVIEALGSICWEMGDVPSAGRFWFFAPADSDAKRAAIETFLRLHGGNASAIISSLPRRLRQTPRLSLPVEVQQRLARLGCQPTAKTLASASISHLSHRRRDMTFDLLAFSVLTLVGLFVIACFSVGFAQIVRLP